MPRDIYTLTISDLSTFTKTLRANLKQQDGVPGHSKLLTMIAKAAGYGNYQHLKATRPSPPRNKLLDKALRVFNDDGIMTRWPKQMAVQGLCLWVFWARLPAKTDMTESTVNAVLKTGSSFGDHVLMRRSLIDHKLVTRTTDGKTYRRIEQAPPKEAAALIAQIYRPS